MDLPARARKAAIARGLAVPECWVSTASYRAAIALHLGIAPRSANRLSGGSRKPIREGVLHGSRGGRGPSRKRSACRLVMRRTAREALHRGRRLVYPCVHGIGE